MPKVERKPMFEVWKGGFLWWYWRLRAANGEIVARSQGYSRKSSAVKACERLRSMIADAGIEVV